MEHGPADGPIDSEGRTAMHTPQDSPTHTPRTARRRARRVVAPVALCLALGTGTLACGGGSDDESANEAADQLAEQIAESGAGDDADVDIDSETGQVDVSTEDGDMSFGEGTELPEDFPADIPLPQDYELTSAMSTDTGDATGWTISGELPDADDSTFDDLVAEFTSAGWSKSSDATTEVDGGTSGTAMLDDGTWQVVLSVQVGVQDMPDSFSYLVSSAA